jgi:uncharacterized protein
MRCRVFYSAPTQPASTSTRLRGRRRPHLTNPRDVLNRLRWEDGRDRLEGVVIFYRHRGAPNDTATLRGEDVQAIGRSFLDLPEGARLPMHRILRIDVDGRTLWDRTRHGRPP